MKYLKIHKLIWFVFCLIYTLVEMLMYVFVNIICFVWSFELVRWKDIFYAETWWDNKWDGKPYIDYSPIDTFCRHYNMFNSMD